MAEGFANIAKKYYLVMACVKNVWAVVISGYLRTYLSIYNMYVLYILYIYICVYYMYILHITYNMYIMYVCII